jgi:DNA mismatch repair protein MutL
VNRIRLLPDHVANQIAAGEVVERPASVVKELVENALDADAHRVTVEIGAGGRSLIRVTDDGYGMSRDDALLCLERHATSKIRKAEDLSAITTMGFRGEALPSIASISRFTLTSRERDETTGEGTSVIVQGGRIAEVRAAANPHGTSIEARSLFFNLPARRKFLRSEETERSHIQHYLVLAALGHPHVGFSFISDGRLVWQLPPLPAETTAHRLDALRERLRQLHGGNTQWVPVDFSSQIEEAPGSDDPEVPVLREPIASHFRLWGLIGAPGASRATRDEQHLFVNRRPIENRGLNHALLEGYHTALMKGRYPVCCLFLEIDPAAVDVNIHPAKREVKFREEGAVRRLVAKGVRDALLQFARQQERTVDMPVQQGLAAAQAQPVLQGARVQQAPQAPQAPQDRTDRTDPSDPSDQSDLPRPRPPAPATAAPPPPALAAPEPAPLLPAFAPAPRPVAVASPAANSPLLSIPLRLVGVIGRLYVVLESDRGLVLLDQHAAHERILFEQMLDRMEQAEQAPSQRLLLPETLEVSIRDADFVRRHLTILNRLGVSLREFGERTFLLDALPPFIRVSDPRRFTLDLVDALKAAGTTVNTLRVGEEMVAKTVCRHAVKANDPLRGPELEKLVDDLRNCQMPYTCPHGRPTLIEMGWRELERRFGRVQ